MIDYFKEILSSQFEASLAMLSECIEICPAEAWEEKVGNNAFWFVAYHTLCYVDLYLSPSNDAFQRREFHNREGDNAFLPPEGVTFSRQQTSDYLAACRRKAAEMFAAETVESLQRESGFPWVPFTRGELHLYNLRHVQHHTGQLTAFLRKRGLQPAWVGSGRRASQS